MAVKKKQRWKSYQDYLNSDEWAKIKSEFYHSYEGFTNVCEVSGEMSDTMNLHHWRYSKDWNDDNTSNLVLVCDQIHEWLHGGAHDLIMEDEKVDTAKKYVTSAIELLIEKKSDCNVEYYLESKNKDKVILKYQKHVDRLENHVDLLREKLKNA